MYECVNKCKYVFACIIFQYYDHNISVCGNIEHKKFIIIFFLLHRNFSINHVCIFLHIENKFMFIFFVCILSKE